MKYIIRYIFSSSIVLWAGVSSCQKSPEIESFEVADGLEIELVAAEPLIKDPVDLEFNELGDAMVLEMPGYPYEDAQSRLVVLKDHDHDGRYEEAFTFIENLQLANSFMPYEKGVLVAAPPYLLFVHDDNLDYVPEAVDTLMGGFSTGNLQHNYNGLTLGLDGWIYAANGGNDGAPYWWNDTTSRLDLRGQDFRFDLKSKKIERLGESSGGFGIALDTYGRLFETHNLTHISHLVFPDRYLKDRPLLAGSMLENISTHDDNGLGRIYPIGEQETRVNHPEQSGYFSGSCGTAYYHSGVLGDTYDQTVWVADVVLNLIHVDRIRPNVASFAADRILIEKEVVASRDRSFRPVNMTVGPDGHMYIVDMYRSVIEHPEWIPDEIEATLDLEAGKNKGRIYRIQSTQLYERYEPLDWAAPLVLTQSLSSPLQWKRNTAHRLLLEKQLTQQELTSLLDLTKSENGLDRLHSRWILHQKNQLPITHVLEALKDLSAPIRENALIMAESYIEQNEEVKTSILTLLADENPRVRMQAALSYSLVYSHSTDPLPGQLLDAIVQTGAVENDQWNLAALTLATGDRSAEVLSLLIDTPTEKVKPEMIQSLALSAATDPSSLSRVLKALSSSALTSDMKASLVQLLAGGLSKSDPASILPWIILLEKNANSSALLLALSKMRASLGISPSDKYFSMSQQALMHITDTSVDVNFRVDQLDLVQLLPYGKKSEVLFQCLNQSEPLIIQERALRQLAEYREIEIGQKIIERWSSLSPTTRRLASDLLLYIEIHHDALLTGLETGTINIGEMNFDLERRRQLLWWTDNENTRQRAERLFSDAGVVNRKEAIELMKPALQLKGDPVNGQSVFNNSCSSCHVFAELGSSVGPNLTEISRKSKATLLHDILDPNAAVDPKYINHLIETTEGVIYTGIVTQETDQRITLTQMGGTTMQLNKKEIKRFQSMGSSLMMEGLENGINHQEMADLLAFLQNLN